LPPVSLFWPASIYWQESCSTSQRWTYSRVS